MSLYYDPPGPAGPRRVELVDAPSSSTAVTYSYAPTSLAGLIIAIVIMIIAIVVVIWLIQAGVSIANQVLANGARRGFPIPYIIGIVMAIVVVIVTIILIIWVINLARNASRAATGMTRLSPVSSVAYSTPSNVSYATPPIYRTPY